MAKKKKTYRQFKNERKCKTVKRRGRNDDYDTPKNDKVPTEKGCRIGGSTTHVLPEPRAGKVESEIVRIDTPPPPEINL